MPILTGKQYTCPTHGTTVVVTRGGKGELMCGDVYFVQGRGNKADGEAFSVNIGKRYTCPPPPPAPKEGEPAVVDLVPRIDVLCIVPGDCTLSVKSPMVEIEPKVLPSAD